VPADDLDQRDDVRRIEGCPTTQRSGCAHFDCMTLIVIPDELEAMERQGVVVHVANHACLSQRLELVGDHDERHAVEVRAPRALCRRASLQSSHIIPLVEVVGGTKTSHEAIEQAMRFYAGIGKKAIHLRKELPGHVANRLQAALYREVAYLIQTAS